MILHNENTDVLTNWYRLGCGILLITYPLLMRYRLKFYPDPTLRQNNVQFRNFMRATPFGYVFGITTLSASLALYLFDFPFWSVPMTYVLIATCMYCYYRDYIKTITSASTLFLYSSQKMETTKDTKVSVHVHPLKPNFHYGLAYGICGIISVILSQLYVSSTCTFSSQSWESCLAYYVTSVGEDQRSSPSQLVWKLVFRIWTSIISYIMELYSVFAFSDSHFLHRSYFWRYTEDLTVSVGVVTERNRTILILLLVFNFFFVMFKDAGFIDDIIWSLINRKWIYSTSHSLASDVSTRLPMLIHEVRSQVIRSKLSFVSRISSIIFIGTIALLDNAYLNNGEAIFHMSEFSNILLAVPVVVIQIAASRQLNFLVFEKKKARLRDIINNSSSEIGDHQYEIDSINYGDAEVLNGWRLYLTAMSILACFVYHPCIKFYAFLAF
ncbi:hypothetical protein BKA69DRAFT_1085236 [Paraphysoderma sedebokerense]|nr:hypothetical protein BKA69DRAFT_1085236 [Paraphysoderma sedebokerense]